VASQHPYYRKWLPARKTESDFSGDGKIIDLTGAHLDETTSDRVTRARSRFDDRSAAAIRAAAAVDGTGGDGPPRIWPRVELTYVLVPSEDPHIHFDRVPRDEPWFDGKKNLFEPRDLLEMKWYGNEAPTIHIPRSKCLALLAYLDYFPGNPRLGLGLRSMVSRAVLAASPGWCGTFGPGVDGTFSLKGAEGNYDMSEMHLLPMVYRHYDDLSPGARELLITQLLARGRIHRPRKNDTFTSGGNPNDWSRAGFISPAGYHIDIGETENHILMIVTARYLTNQLLYQRDRASEHDNRRNASDDSLSCFSLLLSLLRNMLRGDFSEYNAKSYQSETRWALLNLCTYAYDHEVRLGARMVLDYISAHIAVSTNDLRRLVPFRRRLTDDNGAHTSNGFMTVGLLAASPAGTDRGADPMGPYFAMQAGNIRAYEMPHPSGPAPFGIADGGTDLAMEVLSDYRLPPSIHDLFVTDQHRRFFQRLHRTPRAEVGGNRNCENMEIYASSPSYLITAGGAPALWAVDPSVYAVIDGDAVSQQLGVAVTTSFMPTGFLENEAAGLIQFGSFSRKITLKTHWEFLGFDVADTNIVTPMSVQNYGVAPDFACGAQVYLPWWVDKNITEGIRDGVPQDPHGTQGWSFVNMGRTGARDAYAPGFFLAIYQETPGLFALMEAFDTWLNPGVTFRDFKADVLQRNGGIRIFSNTKTHYTTRNGNHLDFVVWTSNDGRSAKFGAEVTDIRYGGLGSVDSIGNAETITGRLLSGTIMNSPEEAKVEINNPSLGSRLTLDFTDPAHPRRFDSQTGEFEVAGFNNEVWLDFEYQGPTEGDVCRPLNTLGSATAAVADGGVIRIVPGATWERGTIGGGKSFTLLAPIGGVTIGTPDTTSVLSPDVLVGVSNRDVWVEFDWPNEGDVPYLFRHLAAALNAVADGGVVNIQPGSTQERLTIGGGKRFTLVAPIGGVTIGAR
jgi:hypothetical protein